MNVAWINEKLRRKSKKHKAPTNAPVQSNPVVISIPEKRHGKLRSYDRVVFSQFAPGHFPPRLILRFEDYSPLEPHAVCSPGYAGHITATPDSMLAYAELFFAAAEYLEKKGAGK